MTASRPAGPARASVRLPDSVAPFAAAGAAAGAVPAATKLTIQFWMAPRSAAAARYAAAVSTPGNPLFRHFLSPSSYTARFGPAPAAVDALESWLRSKGFTGIGADLGRDYVQATAPVSTIEAALQVRLGYYQTGALAGAGRYRLRANDRPVSLPASVARNVLGVTGLDNAAPTMTYVRKGIPARAGVTTAPARRRSPARSGTCSITRPACPRCTASPSSPRSSAVTRRSNSAVPTTSPRATSARASPWP